MADDGDTRARILLATTGNWQSRNNRPEDLDEVRQALSALISNTSNEDSAKGLTSISVSDAELTTYPAWKSCSSAAHHPDPRMEGIKYALLSPGVFKKDAAGVETCEVDTGQSGFEWPKHAKWDFVVPSQRTAIDPGDGSARLLFLYKDIDQEAALKSDGSASPGLWGWPPSHPSAAQRVWSVVARNQLATSLFVLWVAGAIFVSVWIWFAGHFVALAAEKMSNPKIGAACVASVPDDVDKAWKVPANRCDDRWLLAWWLAEPCIEPQAEQGRAAPQKCGYRKEFGTPDDGPPSYLSRRFWAWSSYRGKPSLIAPFLWSMSTILMLIAAAGIGLRGRMIGALIDERCRVSLTRTQQIAWTTLILSGFGIMAWFNSAMSAADLMQALQQASAKGADASVFSAIPTMQLELWAAIGINILASPALSALISNAKDAPKDTDPALRPIIAADPLDRNRTPGEARVVDLVLGDSVANQYSVDISRLQHLVITGLLLVSYFFLLWQAFAKIDGRSVLYALSTLEAGGSQGSGMVFSAMPPVSTAFVGLLLLSHAGYLAFKAIDKKSTQQPS
jgi:hypothetical protein